MMKKFMALLLALTISVLCVGCGSSDNAPSTAAPTETATQTPSTAVPTTEVPTTAEPTTEPTEAPTEPPVVYSNPLTGETLEAPLENRIFGVTIDNIPSALPHVGMAKADMVFEMLINDYATRCLALYTDIRAVESIGAVRSMRVNFTDIAQGYDAFIAHAGGSSYVLNDAAKSKINHFNIDVANDSYYAFRDGVRQSKGISRVHCLLAKGPGLYDLAVKKGVRVTQDPEKTYGMNFTVTPCPEDGQSANLIDIVFNLYGHKKTSTMTYDEALGEYIFTQYGKKADSVKPENLESFKNVFVVVTSVQNVDVYHIADIVGSGEGYFACEGKMIPIKWIRENEHDPFSFTLADGTPLEQGIGRSYVAIVPTTSTISAE